MWEEVLSCEFYMALNANLHIRTLEGLFLLPIIWFKRRKHGVTEILGLLC